MDGKVLVAAAFLALPATAQTAGAGRTSAETLAMRHPQYTLEPDRKTAALYVVDAYRRPLGRLEGVDRVIMYRNGEPFTVQLVPTASRSGPGTGGLTWNTSTIIYYDGANCSGTGHIYRILPGTPLFGMAALEDGRLSMLLARTTGLRLFQPLSQRDTVSGACTVRGSAMYAAPIEARVPIDGRWTSPFFVE